MFKNYPKEKSVDRSPNGALGKTHKPEKGTGRGGTHTPPSNSPHNARPPTPMNEVSTGEHFHKLGQ